MSYATVYNFEAIPEEFKQRKQWVYWKNVDEGKAKPTKVPINPYTGKYASPTNPDHWCWAYELVHGIPGIDGIGYVIHTDDPYVCIDFDKVTDPEILEKQNLIYNAFNSYTEISPSGDGCHIWVKGKVPHNRNRAHVEIYTAGHYMTFTGKVCRNVPIQDYNILLNQLWAEMETKPESHGHYVNKPQVYTDYEILTMASSAVNGEKFINLYEGRWLQYFPFEDGVKTSCNEADQALTNILAFYTQNREQIKRIFRASVLGQRQKARREDYFENPKWGMLNKAFDQLPQDCDMSTLRNNLEQQLAAKRQAVIPPETSQGAPQSVNEPQLMQVPAVNTEQPSQPTSDTYENTNIQIPECVEYSTPEPKPKKKSKDKHSCSVPPGIVGVIAQFIYEAAPLPVCEIAIAGAIGLMCGVVGRSYNVSGVGLNQYLILLANTGCGKEAAASGIDRLMGEVKKTVPAASEFMGPSEIASPQALLKYISKTSKCFMSLVGEFCIKLQQISSVKANPYELGLRRTLLDLYNKSGKGKLLGQMIYSDKDKNTDVVESPTFSILGEGTPEKFYEILNKEMIEGGLLPRFLIIEYKGKRVQLNKNHLTVKPSQQLVDQLSAICAYSLQLNNGNNVLDVKTDDESQKLFNDFSKYCNDEINNAHNEVTRQLWNRAHIKSLKLAALLAVGVNYINPVINLECANWALKLVVDDIQNLLHRFDSGNVGIDSVQNDQLIDIRKAFNKYLTSDWTELEKANGASLATHSIKVVPHSYVSSYCRQRSSFKNDRLGPIPALRTCLQSLVDSDEIRELTPMDKKTRGFHLSSKLYMVSGMKL